LVNASQRYSIGDAFAQLAIIRTSARNTCGAVRPRRPWSGCLRPRQIAPYPLNQRRLPIEKIADRLQQRLRPHALPQQFEIGKAHLPRRRTRHGSTQRADNCRTQASRFATHPAADGIGRLFGVAASHLPIRDIAHRNGKTCRRKTPEMSIPPYYLAFRDRN
jgi:hypothetical protein